MFVLKREFRNIFLSCVRSCR